MLVVCICYFLLIYVDTWCYLLIFVSICWYLLLFGAICWYLFIFVTICWFLLQFVVTCWYLLSFVNIMCWYLLIFVDFCCSLLIFAAICWYLLLFVDICDYSWFGGICCFCWYFYLVIDLFIFVNIICCYLLRFVPIYMKIYQFPLFYVCPPYFDIIFVDYNYVGINLWIFLMMFVHIRWYLISSRIQKYTPIYPEVCSEAYPEGRVTGQHMST